VTGRCCWSASPARLCLVGPAADFPQEAADSSPKAIVLAHRTEPAGFPFAQFRSDKASQTRPASAKTSASVGARVDGQPALQLVFDVDGGTWTLRVTDVRRDASRSAHPLPRHRLQRQRARRRAASRAACAANLSWPRARWPPGPRQGGGTRTAHRPLVRAEWAQREERRIARVLRISALPPDKTLRTLRLDRLPPLIREQLRKNARRTDEPSSA
jgi:hypothetical protein